MKLSLFSITAILASFVAANPILAPRAPSRSFSLYGNFGRSSSLLLAIRPVAEANYPGYFQFGWYGKGSQQIELFFTQNELYAGPVSNALQNGYEMVMQKVTDSGPTYYRALLVDRDNTALTGLQSSSLFYNRGRFNFSPDGSERISSSSDQNWITCIRSATTVETDPEYVEELYFGYNPPRGCNFGRKPEYLTVRYESSAPIQLVAGAPVSLSG